MKRSSFVTTLAATAAGASLTGTARALSQLRGGTMPADFGAQIYYANDLGMFAKAGYAVDVATMNNGAVIAAAIAGGSLDFGYSNVLSLATAHDKGAPFVLLSGANMYLATSPTVGIIAVARNSPIKTAADLSGKVVATASINNIQELGARNWVDANGGDSSKVKFIEMPNPQVAAALLAGRIDAGIMNQGDYPTLGKPNDPIRVIANAFNSIAPSFISGAWFTTSSWVADHPVEAKAIVTVLNDAARWGNTHHPESAAIVAKHLDQSPAAIAATERVVYATAIDLRALQPPIDVAAKYGLIKTAFPARDIVSTVAQ